MRALPSSLLAIVLALAGCGRREPPSAPERAAGPAEAPAIAHETAAPPSRPAAPDAATATETETFIGTDAGTAPPPPVERKGRDWPFHTWTRAEAVLFNTFPMRPEAPLFAYDERGWSPHIVDRKPLDDASARHAVETVVAHEGDVAVSKCPFPRHAVVLFDADVPVASINVCFQCGDILLWPRWSPAPEWAKMTAAQMKAHEARETKHLKRYEAVFPRWRSFFADEVGFPIDPPPSPTR